MVQSLEVSHQTTFTQILDRFGENAPDQHLRMKDGDEGRMLYSHEGKFSLIGHGLLVKQSKVMERRNEATDFVIDAFKRQFSGSPQQVEKVLRHVMSDPSFDKVEEFGDTRLQLRGSDVSRLNELMLTELERTEQITSHIDPKKTDYGNLLLTESTVQAFGAKPGERTPILQSEDVARFPQRFDGILKERIAVHSTTALLDSDFQGLFTGDVKHFHGALAKHSDVLLTPEVMKAPEMSGLESIIGASLALHHAGKAFSPDMSVAVNLGSGSPVLVPMPTDSDERGIEARRMNSARYQEWAANEIETHFFGDRDVLGLGEGTLSQVREELAKANDKINKLKDQISNSQDRNTREELALKLHDAIREKLGIMQSSLDERVGVVLELFEGRKDNPVGDTLKTLQTETGRQEALRLKGAFDQIHRTQTQNTEQTQNV
jgi:hypothetical protein